MGPRLNRRGKGRCPERRHDRRGASMGPRLNRRGKGRKRPSLAITQPGFNGATPQQAWKVMRIEPKLEDAEALLQWGHASTGVERIRRQARRALQRTASMGPRLNRRGKGGGLGCVLLSEMRFNGATPQQAWKVMPAWRPMVLCNAASMGPRLNRRGKWELEPGARVLERAASMGPRLNRRGK